MQGTVVGDRYHLDSVLGEGGMGVVYLAKDTVLDRSVALKIFRDGMEDKARTASESQLLASLNHPALVTLFDAHVAEHAPRYLVMEYVDGPTLQSVLTAGPLPARTVARIARDLAEALHVVHRAGIVHRDVKPSNVLLRPSSVPGEQFHAKLADFGIAYLLDSTRLTVPGTVIGTAAYLSPEQVTGASPGPASDIYSLGLVLIETLTGRRAFAQESGTEAALARLAGDPVVPASLGTEWGAVLTDMTARDPAHRPSALDVVVRVAEFGIRPAAAPLDDTVADPVPVLPDTRDADPSTLVLSDVIGSPSESESELRAGNRRRAVTRWTVALVALVGVGAVLFGVAALLPGEEPALPPALPAVDEPLGSHLEQLMDSVSP
ncbi:serine/threonine protein kinase [Microbacterium sp. SLBN-146]|nr:serine/threonine protein kinase [Microbacterium sp. SLBN-146]